MSRALPLVGRAAQATPSAHGIPQRLVPEPGDLPDEEDALPVGVCAHALREPFVEGAAPDNQEGALLRAADGGSSRLPLHEPKLSEGRAALQHRHHGAQVRRGPEGVEAFGDVLSLGVVEFHDGLVLLAPEAAAASPLLLLGDHHVVLREVPGRRLGVLADPDLHGTSHHHVAIHRVVALPEEHLAFFSILQKRELGEVEDGA
mmetsp:Transcript_20116/g.47553  ORF Transcript_20116/g.47553 Transcript_20116/m.47553 type:complete len:203 (-) Transcript_20116:48-656(-)